MPRFDPTDARLSADAFSDFDQLNRLDDLWTSYLREPGPVPPVEVEGLATITGQMRVLLVRVRGHAEDIIEFISRRRRDFDQAFRTTIAAASLSSDQRTAIEQVVGEAGGFAQFSVNQLNVIQRQSGEESQLLEGKMTQIRERGIAPGDFTFRYKCALVIAVLAATIALLVAHGTILIPAVVAAVQAGPAAIIAAFNAHGGWIFLVDGIKAIEGISKTIDSCFRASHLN